jgi:hypothetical protein
MIEKREKPVTVQSNKPNSNFKVINISESPKYTSSEFDIVDELLSNRDHYLASPGDPTLSILSYPVSCSMNVERLRDQVAAQSKSGRKPGLHASISACIYYGTTYFLEEENIRSLISAKTKFNMIDERVKSSVANIVNGMFSQYTLATDLPRGKRTNVFLPSHIHAPLSALANDLSSDSSRVHMQNLSVLTVMHTLSLQPDTLEDHAEMMKSTVQAFIDSVTLLNRAVKAIMREFKL